MGGIPPAFQSIGKENNTHATPEYDQLHARIQEFSSGGGGGGGGPGQPDKKALTRGFFYGPQLILLKSNG